MPPMGRYISNNQSMFITDMCLADSQFLFTESKVQLPECQRRDRESKTTLRQQDEREFFLDIVKDIANDLDLKSMTEKITENLTILLDADGASLFFVEGSHGNKTLISKIFDIHTGTNIIPTSTSSDNCVQVPWGKGFIGHVAESGQTVNVVDPSKVCLHFKYFYSDETHCKGSK